MSASSKTGFPILLAISSRLAVKKSHTIIVTERANQTKLWPLPRYIYWIQFFVIPQTRFFWLPTYHLCHSIYIHDSRLDSKGVRSSKLSSSWRASGKMRWFYALEEKKTVLLECNPTPEQNRVCNGGGTWSTSHICRIFSYINYE